MTALRAGGVHQDVFSIPFQAIQHCGVQSRLYRRTSTQGLQIQEEMIVRMTFNCVYLLTYHSVVADLVSVFHIKYVHDVQKGLKSTVPHVSSRAPCYASSKSSSSSSLSAEFAPEPPNVAFPLLTLVFINAGRGSSAEATPCNISNLPWQQQPCEARPYHPAPSVLHHLSRAPTPALRGTTMMS